MNRTPTPGLVTGLAGLLICGALLFARDGAVPPLSTAPAGPGGAVNLTLAPDLSFTDDSSANFPIRGEHLDDGAVASDRPTAIFLGTSHCWNTNREAERFVELYKRHGDEGRFLVVDLDHPAPAQRALIARFSTGYIPTLAFLDRNGKTVFKRSGETAKTRGDASELERLLRDALARR